MGMIASEAPPATDAAELQNVLTRYVDSADGYRKAAEVVDEAHLADAFLEISKHRQELVGRVSSMIVRQGEKSDTGGSPEAAIHRWWMGLRAGMTDDELHATLEECVRGEKELQRTIKDAQFHGNLAFEHQMIIADMAVELDDTIRSFQAALDH